MQKIRSISSIYSWDIADFRVPGITGSYCAYPKWLLAFLTPFISMQKISSIHSSIHLETSRVVATTSDHNQSGKLLQATYHRRSTYRYAEARIGLHGTSIPFPRLFCLFHVISHFIVPPHKSAEVQHFEISRGTCPTNSFCFKTFTTYLSPHVLRFRRRW